MRKFILTIAFFASVFGVLQAQPVTYKSDKIKIQRAGVVDVSAITEDWQPSLKNKEAVEADDMIDKAELENGKRLIAAKYPSGKGQHSYERTNQNAGPYVLRNYQGNVIGTSVPNDNTVAVSNGNKLISAINLNLYMYDINNGSLLKNIALSTFGASLGLVTSQLSDPKLLYDPVADRFILVYFGGFTPANSQMAICFSATNDPTGVWNLYKIPGNPLNDTTFSDYPAIAISNGELFLTINEVIPNQSWQVGFKQTRAWQIGLQEGYSGALSLNARIWSGINFDGKPVRYFCPVSGGSQPYGPNMYFISNKNFGIQTDSLLLLEITGLQSDTATKLNITYLNTNVPYGMPPDAKQGGNQTLATNDARVLGAFLENGKIQYVHNCVDTITGHAAIYHGVIDNITTNPSVTGTILGDNILDFGYPNISYAGSGSDNSSIISFNYSALTVFAGSAAVSYDGAGNYSALTNIKSGVNYINMLSGNTERWGDYSGSQRKFNEPGRVWTTTTFGTGTWYHGTWIAEISLNSAILVANPPRPIHGFAFPNPAKDLISVNFNNPSEQNIAIEIYNTEGKLVRSLLNEKASRGENIFSFSTAPLAQGIYFLKISSEKGAIFSQKIMKD